MHLQWPIQDFSEGVPTLERGANLLFGQFFPENCIKMKKRWAGGRGGVRPLRSPRSATDLQKPAVVSFEGIFIFYFNLIKYGVFSAADQGFGPGRLRKYWHNLTDRIKQIDLNKANNPTRCLGTASGPQKLKTVIVTVSYFFWLKMWKHLTL